MLTRLNEQSSSTVIIPPMNPGTKLLQRLFYYLEKNRTLHHHHHHHASTDESYEPPSSSQVNNGGISLPLNSITWFLHQYTVYDEQEDVVGPLNNISVDHRNLDNINDYDEQRHLIRLIKPLLLYCTKLRITSQPWSNDTKITVTSPRPTTTSSSSSSSSIPVSIRADFVPGLMDQSKDDNLSCSRRYDKVVRNRVVSQRILVLTKYISDVFPKLHTLWFDQISWHDILERNNDTWMTQRFINRSSSINNTISMDDGSIHHLCVLRIDLLHDDDDDDDDNNTNNNNSPTDGDMEMNPKNTSTTSSNDDHSFVPIRKKRTQVLHQGTNFAMILASLPSTQVTNSYARSMSSKEKDGSRTHHLEASNDDTCIACSGHNQHQTSLDKPDLHDRSIPLLANENDITSNDAETRPIIEFPHVRHLKCTSRHQWYGHIHKTFPSIQSLCFSHNGIRTTNDALDGLDQLHYLQQLDLSYNQLSSLHNAHYQLGHITTLNVSHNCIITVDGIDRLYSLQVLHIEHNRISDLHNTASRLANLPLLKELYIMGNPCCSEEQLSSSHVRNSSSNTSGADSSINETKKKTLLYYHVNIWNAFIERRLSTLYKAQNLRQQLTIRDVQDELIPRIDGILPSKRQWYILKNRVFTTIEQPFVVKHDIKQLTTKQDSGAVCTAPIDMLNSYICQANTSMRRPTRHKNRAMVSMDGFYKKSAAVSVVDGHNDFLEDHPIPSFSVYDVFDSLRLQPDAALPSNIPPSITCLHDTELSPGTTSTKDSDDLLSLDENIGQQYLDLIALPQQHILSTADIVQAPSSTHDISIRTPTEDKIVLATSEVDSHESNTFGNSVNGKNKSGVATKDDLEASKDVPVAHDMDVTLLSEENEYEHREIASIDNSLQTFETMENLSLCRDSIDCSIGPLEQSVEKSNTSKTMQSIGRIANGGVTVSGSPESPQNKLTLLVSSFSESQWHDDNISLPSGINLNNASPAEKSNSSNELSRDEIFRVAELYSKYVGPKTYQKLLVGENLELYFRLFVFSPDLALAPISKAQSMEEDWRLEVQRYPRIRLWPVDRAKRDEVVARTLSQVAQFDVLKSNIGDQHELFHRIWRERVVGCGKPSLRRLTPSRVARYGFHGELLWSAAESSQISPEAVVECREVICCLTDVSFYIIVDHDTVTCKPQKDSKREFPLPIPVSATFKDAKWPHALACHSLDTLRGITIGFGFQRLILHFEDAASPNNWYAYVLLTCNKLETIELLKVLQDLTSVESDLVGRSHLLQNPKVRIENDDPLVLDSLASAVSPDIVGVVLHYQVLQQKWKSGGRGNVRRVCVVTDSKVYLLDEDYVGDGSDTVIIDSNIENNVGGLTTRKKLGDCLYRLVDSADLFQIEYVQSDGADPNSVTIVMKPLTRLTRRRNWRLVCRDRRQGAERLVEDLRKAISMLQ